MHGYHCNVHSKCAFMSVQPLHSMAEKCQQLASLVPCDLSWVLIADCYVSPVLYCPRCIAFQRTASDPSLMVKAFTFLFFILIDRVCISLVCVDHKVGVAAACIFSLKGGLCEGYLTHVDGRWLSWQTSVLLEPGDQPWGPGGGLGGLRCFSLGWMVRNAACGVTCSVQPFLKCQEAPNDISPGCECCAGPFWNAM